MQDNDLPARRDTRRRGALQHAEFLLTLIAEQPDMTLDEIVAAMRKRRIAASRSAVWRLFDRHNITPTPTSRSGSQPGNSDRRRHVQRMEMKHLLKLLEKKRELLETAVLRTKQARSDLGGS